MAGDWLSGLTEIERRVLASVQRRSARCDSCGYQVGLFVFKEELIGVCPECTRGVLEGLSMEDVSEDLRWLKEEAIRECLRQDPERPRRLLEARVRPTPKALESWKGLAVRWSCWWTLARLKNQEEAPAVLSSLSASVTVHTEIDVVWPGIEGMPPDPDPRYFVEVDEYIQDFESRRSDFLLSFGLMSAIGQVVIVRVNGEDTRHPHPSLRVELEGMTGAEGKKKLDEWAEPLRLSWEIEGRVRSGPYEALAAVALYPVVLNVDEGRAYHPAEGTIRFADESPDRTEWTSEERDAFWGTLEEAVLGDSRDTVPESR